MLLCVALFTALSVCARRAGAARALRLLCPSCFLCPCWVSFLNFPLRPSSCLSAVCCYASKLFCVAARFCVIIVGTLLPREKPFGSNVLCVCFVDAQYLFAWDFNAHICACMNSRGASEHSFRGKNPLGAMFLHGVSVCATHVKLKLSMCASAPVISERSFRKKTPWKPRCG